MATPSVIGALRVVLSASTIKFEEGLNKAQRALASFGALANTQLAKFGALLAATFAAGVIGRFVKGTVDLTDKIGDLSESLGISVEQLSALKHAADLSGASLEVLETSLNLLNKNLGEIATGKLTQAGRALRVMGVEATDANGKLRDQVEILLDVADRFSRYEDGSNKAALAMALFGKQGAQLIPLLNKGRSGITELMREAQRLGIVLDEKASKAAGEFNDNLDRLKNRLQGFTIGVFGPVIELLNRFHIGLMEAKNALAAYAIASATFAGPAAVKQMREELEKLAAAARAARAEADGWGAITIRAGEDAEQGVAPAIKTFEDFLPAAKAARDANRELLDDFVNLDTTMIVDKLNAINAAHDQGTINTKEYGKMTKQVNDQNADAFEAMLGTVSQSLTVLFEDNKAAAIGSALINTYVGITRTLREYPPPYSFVMAGLQAAMGAKQIAAIRSTSRSGSGSSPSVGGGGAVPQAAAEAPAEPMNSTLFVRGLGPSDLFTGEMMRDFADKVMEFQKDGGKIVFAQ